MSKPQFQISEPARKDIAHIWANVYDRSLSARVADKVLDELYDGILFLAENPEAGH